MRCRVTRLKKSAEEPDGEETYVYCQDCDMVVRRKAGGDEMSNQKDKQLYIPTVTIRYTQFRSIPPTAHHDIEFNPDRPLAFVFQESAINRYSVYYTTRKRLARYR